MEEQLEDYPVDAPDLLVVMREVAFGRVPNSGLGRAVAGWLKEKPVPFSEKFMDLEAKYWASKQGGAVQGTWDGLGACPVCKRESGGEDHESIRRCEEFLARVGSG